jgi:hypothetical protein
MITKDLIPEVGAKPFVIMTCLLRGLCPEVTFVSAGSCNPRSRASSWPGALSWVFTIWIARVKARDNRFVKAVTHDTSGRDGNLQVILRRVLGGGAPEQRGGVRGRAGQPGTGTM